MGVSRAHAIAADTTQHGRHVAYARICKQLPGVVPVLSPHTQIRGCPCHVILGQITALPDCLVSYPVMPTRYFTQPHPLALRLRTPTRSLTRAYPPCPSPEHIHLLSHQCKPTRFLTQAHSPSPSPKHARSHPHPRGVLSCVPGSRGRAEAQADGGGSSQMGARCAGGKR